MAKKKRRKSSRVAGKCKVIRFKNIGLRKVCWGKNGKIKSNTKAR